MMEGKNGPRVNSIESEQQSKRSIGATSSTTGASVHSPYPMTSGFDTRTDTTELSGTTATINPLSLGQMAESTTEYGSVLRDCVAQSLRRYFKDLNGQRPEGLYNLVINEIEYPLLLTVMRECDYNQSRAAQVMGINRNTLRKKLKHHGIV